MDIKDFPPEYLSLKYLTLNQDLITEDLKTHWNDCGWKEKRSGQFVLNREFLAAILDRNLRYLEIGPYGRPFLNKNFFDVMYFDVLDQESLKEKSKLDLDHKEENIPFIDFVDPFGDLSIIKEKFDCAFSSHCIEHQPDILGHLKKVSELIETSGLYITIIPNYKYCFDKFKPQSTLIDVMEAYLLSRKIHSQKNILLQQYYSTHNDATLHWAENSGRIKEEEIPVNNVIESIGQVKSEYTDCHAWFFDEDIFMSIFKNPCIEKIIGLKLQRCYITPPNSHEFIAIFQKL